MPANRRIANINKILFILVFLIVLYSVYDLTVHILPDFAAIIYNQGADLTTVKNTHSKSATAASSPLYTVKPLDYYTRDIGKKSLFKYSSGDSMKTQASSMQALPVKAKLQELAQALVLKGVITGDILQAVIEDAKASKTYFVVKNDKIGDIIIDDITPNKVKLRMDGQYIDLTL